MDISMILLSQLKTDPQTLLTECCDTGRPIVVELPDHRMVSIQPIEPTTSDDSLVDELLEINPAFRVLVGKSKQSPRKKFSGS